MPGKFACQKQTSLRPMVRQNSSSPKGRKTQKSFRVKNWWDGGRYQLLGRIVSPHFGDLLCASRIKKKKKTFQWGKEDFGSTSQRNAGCFYHPLLKKTKLVRRNRGTVQEKCREAVSCLKTQQHPWGLGEGATWESLAFEGDIGHKTGQR